MIIKLRFASSTKNYYLCAYLKQKHIIMKKFFTILMAVLCLVAFSVSDAEAKTRKKRSKKQSNQVETIRIVNSLFIIRSVANPSFVLDVCGGIANDEVNV